MLVLSTVEFKNANEFPGNFYLFKVNRSTRKIYEIDSKLTLKIPEPREYSEYISDHLVVFL